METLEEVRARICAALELAEEDGWLDKAVHILEAHTNTRRARKIYDTTTPGTRIRVARELAGMDQRQFARRISLPQQTISRIERNLQELPLQKAPGAAMSLGVSVRWLLAGGSEGGPRTYGSILRAAPTPKALRDAEKARRLEAVRAEVRARNQKANG